MPAVDDELPPHIGARLRADFERIFRRECNPAAAEYEANSNEVPDESDEQ